jgi:hypothetical protein
MTEETNLIVQDHADSAHPLPELPAAANGIVPAEIKLHDKQKEALELIMKGADTEQITKEVGISRTTLWRWRNSDANFVAAVNQWRSQVYSDMHDQITSIGRDAARTVANSVKEKDARLSLTVLDKIGALKRGAEAPVDPYAIFGIGIADTAGRRAHSQRLEQVRNFMSVDQCGRAAKLLALGVVIENDRQGRGSPPELRQLAERFDSDPPQPNGESFDVSGPNLGGGTAEPANNPPIPPPTAVTNVKARVIGYANRGGSFHVDCAHNPSWAASGGFSWHGRLARLARGHGTP